MDPSNTLNVSEFPTEQDVKEALERIKQKNWPKYDPEDSLNDYLSKLSEVFLSELNTSDIIQVFPVNEFPLKFFRVRDVGTFGNINLLCEHSYCPINLTTSLGRCHFPKHPVFYASNNPLVALIEVIKNNNFESTSYCISAWDKVQSSDQLIVQPYLFGELHPNNVFKPWKENIANNLNDPFGNGLTSDQLNGLRLQLEFMAELFLKESDYSVSAFFSHRRIYASHNVKTDILVYPSVQSRFQGINLAVSPNFVDKSLYPSRFYIVKVTNINREDWTFDFTCNSYGLLVNSQIHWKPIKPNDSLYKEIFQKDFGSIQGFNFTELRL